jgi:hypothetical protein
MPVRRSIGVPRVLRAAGTLECESLSQKGESVRGEPVGVDLATPGACHRFGFPLSYALMRGTEFPEGLEGVAKQPCPQRLIHI